MKTSAYILKFLGFQKDKLLDDILKDPIKAYEMMDVINIYKKTIVEGDKDTINAEAHKKHINTEEYRLIEI